MQEAPSSDTELDDSKPPADLHSLRAACATLDARANAIQTAAAEEAARVFLDGGSAVEVEALRAALGEGGSVLVTGAAGYLGVRSRIFRSRSFYTKLMQHMTLTIETCFLKVLTMFRFAM